MDELPLEIHLNILSYLDLSDLFQVRLVSKHFNYIVSHFRPQEIIFSSKDLACNYENTISVWFVDNNAIDVKRVLDESKLFILNCSIFDINYLRRLRINIFRRNRTKITPMLLSKFKMLTSLEVFDFSRGKSTKYSNIITLPNLEYLRVRGRVNFEFDTPALQAVCMNYKNYYRSEITLKNPSSIRFLKSNFLDALNLTQFTNLTHLYCGWRSLTKIYPIISQLQLLNICAGIPFGNNINLLHDLIIYKSQHNLTNLEIYIEGVRSSTLNELSNINLDQLKRSNHIIETLKHYDRLIDGIDLREVNYADLREQLKQIPDDFHLKFPNINHVTLNTQNEDIEQLLRFLSQCKSLSSLAVFYSSLPQSFYDRLTQITHLNSLQITTGRTVVELNSFAFLNNIPYLHSFITNISLLNIQFEEWQFENWSRFEKFEFLLKKKMVRILRMKIKRQYVYKIKLCSNYGVPETASFNATELIEKLNQIKALILSDNRARFNEAPKRKKMKLNHEE